MAVKQILPVERRSLNRLATPHCPRCGDGTCVVGVTRTSGFVYFRCTACDELMVKTIPDIRLRYGMVAQLK